MFELFFIISLSNGQVIREYWPDDFLTRHECTVQGRNRTQNYADQILAKYPSMVSFDISCERKDRLI